MVYAALAFLLLLIGGSPGSIVHGFWLPILLILLTIFLMMAFVQWRSTMNRGPLWGRLEQILYCVDMPLLAFGLAVAPAYLAFSSPLMAVLSLARGLRYGSTSLAIHLLTSAFVFIALFWLNAYWLAHPELIFANLFLLATLPFHFFRVSNRLHETSKSLSEENLKDGLTRSLNRKALDAALWAALSTRKPFVLAFFDLDNFKQVNDTYGHEMGDKVLRRLCARLELRMRGEDKLYRLAGDEFIVLSMMPLRPELAKSFGERVQIAVSEVVHQTCPDLQVSASVGVVVVNQAANMSAGDLIQVADKLMYKAKRAGKNRVEIELLG